MKNNSDNFKKVLSFLKKLNKNPEPIKCLHKTCGTCNGTSVKKDGTPCVHYISCPCKSCKPYSL